MRGLLSDEHFSVDGTQVAAWASMKSFRAKDGSDEPPSGGRNGERDFHGETRSNDTHASTTDPEAQLYRKGKGKEAKLSYIGNALTENRHGLVVEAELGSATGTIEREAAMTMVARHSPGSRRLTLGADKAYDVHGFVDDLRDLNVTPHIAQNTTNRSSAIDARTTRHPGYAISQQKRKRTEEPFGWAKTIGGLARPMLRGVARLRIQVHSDNGSLRPHPAAQIARSIRMRMESTPAAPDAVMGLRSLQRQVIASPVQISATC